MKIIISEKELIKEIKRMLVEVSSQISTSFSAGSMFGKDFEDSASQEFISRSDNYFKNSSLTSKIKVRKYPGAPFEDSTFYLGYSGKFFYGPGVAEELSVIFPIDKQSSDDKVFNFATEEQEAINDPLHFLLLFLGKDNKYHSFYPKGDSATMTRHLKDAKQLLNEKSNVDHLVYSILSVGLANIEKIEISKNLYKPEGQKVKDQPKFLKEYKKNFKDIANTMIKKITASKKKEQTGIKIDNKEPFFIEKGNVKVRYKNYDDNGKPGTFKFGSYRDTRKKPLGDWKAFMEYIKGDSEELKKGVGPKIKAAIIQKESDLKQYWDPDKIKK